MAGKLVGACLGFAALLLIAAPSPNAAPIGTLKTNSYTCTDNGGTGSGEGEYGPACTCIGLSDCARMGQSGVCGKGTISCSGTGCICKWVQTSFKKPGKAPVLTPDGRQKVSR